MKPSSFKPVKMVCGLIGSSRPVFERSEARLMEAFGPLDSSSPEWPFAFTDYYEKEMGKDLIRRFVSFERLIAPESLADIKLRTNALENEIRKELRAGLRVINLDPGYITAAALFMATAKDFSHRVPLQKGIYAHLEFLFGKNEIRFLDWTYPDFHSPPCREYFLKVRRIYLKQLHRL